MGAIVIGYGLMKLFVDGRKKTFSILEQSISKNDKVIWVHAASLGEFEQGLPIIEKLRIEKPSHKILITFFSPSGYEVKKNTSAADTVVRALEAAGQDLTQESFVKGMETLAYFDALTDTQISYSADDHRGADDIVISVVEAGKWKELSRQ